MPAQRTKYTDEYRREAADYALSSDRPITETAAGLGLNSKTLNNWVVRRREELADPQGAAEAKAEDAELRAASRAQAHTRAGDGKRVLEKSERLLRQGAGAVSRYRLMAAESARYPVKLMARLMRVSRSGYYAWVARPALKDPWVCLRAQIERIWLDSARRFGARSILAALPEEFSNTSLYRVRKCMRELGIQGIHPHTSKRTTIADPNAEARPDLVKRDFTSYAPTIKLVGDITYLKTGEGWLYLATVIDLNTRMAVGWALSARMTADIVVAALAMAKGRGYVAEGAIFHSDRGSQYTSKLVADWARENLVRLSAGRTGSCQTTQWQNPSSRL